MTTQLNPLAWTSTAVYFSGGISQPALISVDNSLIAYFDPCGSYGKPTIYVMQGMNRDKFRVNLLANLPSFCQENNIGDKTIFDIFTEKELENKVTICRVNSQSRLKMI